MGLLNPSRLAQPALELERWPLKLLTPKREQEPDRLAAQPSGHEREREQGRRVEPLDVVDGADDRTAPVAVRRAPSTANAIAA